MKQNAKPAHCMHPECDEEVSARGLCETHEQAHRRWVNRKAKAMGVTKKSLWRELAAMGRCLLTASDMQEDFTDDLVVWVVFHGPEKVQPARS